MNASKIDLSCLSPRAAEIREAITRTVKALEIEPGVGLFACAWRACADMSVAEAQDLERRFIDDLVLAVGSVLTREDA